MQLAAGTVVDRYTIEGLLGQGGMAVVYKARHNQLGTAHALKVLQYSTPSIRERLLQEGRVQATLRHANIVSVTDVVDINGAPGLVMELINGVSLEQLLDRTQLTIEQADELAKGIIAGVAEAHRHGLIHRDLKPGNVMLQTTATGLLPKVTDFGLAKVLAADDSKGTATRSGVTMGTPCFMAPEQIRDAKSADKRADVFSLGAILYELVTHHRAFEGDDIVAIFNKVTRGEFVAPTAHAPTLPERMNRAILGALEIDRDKRIPDCDALLAAWLGHAVAPEAPGRASGPWSDELLKSVTEEAQRAGQPTAVPTSEPTWGDAGAAPQATLDPESKRKRPPAPKTTGRESDLGWTPPDRKLPLALVAVGALGLVALIGVGAITVALGLGGMFLANQDAGSAVAAAPPSVPTASPAVPPVVAPAPAEVAPVPAPEAAPPATAPEPAPKATLPAPKATAPAPKETAPAPRAGTAVAVTGDATKVKLTGGGKEYDVPGDVPPGTYTVMATFPASPPVAAGTVTVAEGLPLTLSCGAAFQKCKAK